MTTLGAMRQVSMSATDVDRAVAFYTEVLRVPLIARFGDLAFLDLDGVRLLIERGDEHDGSSVLYFAVPDIASAHRDLVERGVEFVDEPHVIFTDEGGTFGAAGESEWMAFFRDSEGNLLAISSRQRSS